MEIPRVGIARRVGRLTGAGLFGESQKLGEREDWQESGVVGSDTVELAPDHGKLYWAWGDTNVLPYALGFFNAAGATSARRPLTSFQPPLALAYDYVRKPDGQPRGVLDVKSSTPVWVSADVTLLDARRREHLVCRYRRVEKDMRTAEAGLAEWNDAVASGSVAWNPWRKRWVTGFQQKFGKPSVFGEVWYAEADAPTGPWSKAVKVLSHRNYTFYNVRLHQDLTSPDSPVLLFEGTYTAEFADHPVKTARYNYNQILYRLDLDDPALAPAH